MARNSNYSNSGRAATSWGIILTISAFPISSMSFYLITVLLNIFAHLSELNIWITGSLVRGILFLGLMITGIALLFHGHNKASRNSFKRQNYYQPTYSNNNKVSCYRDIHEGPLYCANREIQKIEERQKYHADMARMAFSFFFLDRMLNS